MQKQQKLRISGTPPLSGIRYPALSFHAVRRWPLLARTISALHIVLQMDWSVCSRRDPIETPPEVRIRVKTPSIV